MDNELKVFKVEEANRILPRLTELVTELQTRRNAILKLEVGIDALEIVADKAKPEAAPGLNPKVEEYTRTVNAFYALVDEIHGFGCFLKDVDMGLVDFYSLSKGRVVYLCWKLGEPEVAYWHEIGRGYAYRQPISHSE